MIVNMKKTLLICMQSRRDSALTALRELGVLHVVDVQSPAGDNLEAVEESLANADRALKLLELTAFQAEDGAKSADAGKNLDEQGVIEKILEFADHREHSEQQLKGLQHEIHRIEPLGEFDPAAIGKLREQGLELRLRELPKGEPSHAPEGLTGQIVGIVGTIEIIAYVGPAEAFPEELPGRDFVLPATSLQNLRKQAVEQEDAIEDASNKILEYLGQRERLAAWIETLREERDFYHVRQGMGDSETVAYMEGYCPEPKIGALQSAAEQHGWGLVINDPDPEDEPPTLIQYPSWVKPIKAVFDFLEIQPGYREADISVAFLFFFSLFFGILIGDAGYGLLILGGTFAAGRFFGKGPGYAYKLMYVLGGWTTIWGAMTGNYFGIADLPAPLSGLRVEWLSVKNPDSNGHIMQLSFLIGALHLTLAHVWNIIALAPKPRFLEQLGWAMLVWVMYFAATAMVLQKTFPTFAYGLLGVGLILVILFMTPLKKLKQDWILHVMLPLNVVSCFVDLVSYVRLFAVGLASYSVAKSFNDMALMAGFGNVLSGFLAVLILVFGHVLNIILCALAILVHGVRLNTLEFSLHKELQWAGFAYRPFARSRGEEAE